MRTSSPGELVRDCEALSGSFRDPSGFIFMAHATLYRQVNKVYSPHYRQLMDSGLYDQLVKRAWLVPHQEVEKPVADQSKAYQVIRPELVPFVSYPYEWCFSQLRDAALLTLDVQLLALEYGMTLIDSSGFNVQFMKGKPVVIDTLSFQKYEEGKAWAGYRQFCQHFLSPIALMAKTDVRLNQLLRAYIDGIPMDLASRLLPLRTWWRFGLVTHIHLHAKAQRAWSATDRPEAKAKSRFEHVSLAGLRGLIDGLRKAVVGLTRKADKSEWSDYYSATNYVDDALDHKKELVTEYLSDIRPGNLWDLGANTGLFSRISANMGINTIAFDIDPEAVESNYLKVKQDDERDILPLLLDLSNPSPGLGWSENERESFMGRGPADCAMALALIHHLAISNNLPFSKISDFLSRICKHLVIEFVPKHDRQVQRLLGSRHDIFDEYDQISFERAFSSNFVIRKTDEVRGSERRLYLMEKRD